MDGLIKITEKILNEAHTDAEKILSDAKKSCTEINASYQARAQKIKEDLMAKAEKEATDFIARAKSSAMMRKRNILLEKKSELVDEIFGSTLEGTCSLTGEKYVALLTGLLSFALLEQMEAEKLSRALYGEEEALDPETYEVVLNQQDKEKYGNQVVESTKTRLKGKVPAEKLAKLSLSEKTADIRGGLILHYGNIESNCSLELLFAQLREELEPEVSHIFFAPRVQE